MDIGYAKITIGVALAVLGWLVGHYLTDRRNIRTKRREIVLGHLINAYRILANEVHERSMDSDRFKQLEDIVSDIQLFGSPKQIKLIQACANRLIVDNSFDFKPILENLRYELRNQLQLVADSSDVVWIRWSPATDPASFPFKTSD